MKLSFQKNVLRYFFQRSESKEYLLILNKSIFDIPVYQIAFEILQSYVQQYNKIPNKETITSAFDIEADKIGINTEAYDQILSILEQSFDPMDIDEKFTRDTVIDFAKNQMVKKMFEENADKIGKADEKILKKMYNNMQYIVNLGNDTKEHYEGKYLLKDYTTDRKKPIEGIPTYLHKLNTLTAARGFHKPQLIIIMGGPKGFKTGVLLNIVVNYVRDGLKVFFADAENSVDSISNRAYQCMLGCTREELFEGKYRDELDNIVEGYGAMGGEMRTEYFPAYVSTLDDVDERLEQLHEQDGFKPDLIVYDYLDLFVPTDKRITERRLQIQNVYHHAIRLNNKWGMFGMSPSQINKAAVGKDHINLTDFAEDFAKAHNCHAAFGIAGTDEERLKGFATLVPVAQREGKRFSYHDQCPIVIDEARMLVEYDETFWGRNTETELGGEIAQRPEPSKYTFGKNKKLNA